MKRKTIWSLSILAGAMAVSPICLLAEEPKQDEILTKKIDKILSEVKEVKVGMTRAELLKVFTTEGGISSRKWRRYVYRSCPYIKVDVEFEPIGDQKNALQENPADKITKKSHPFLESSISD